MRGRATRGGAALGALASLSVVIACKKTPPPGDLESPSPSAAPSVIAEVVPRCRVDGPALALPGEDVIVGAAALKDGALFVGLVATRDGRREAGVVRVASDLSGLTFAVAGPALGDDPPPSVRLGPAGEPLLAYYARRGADAGPGAAGRVLVIAPIAVGGDVREARLGAPTASIAQQADESFAFDLAWRPGGGGLAAWDEDGPVAPGRRAPDRGIVKVEALAGGKTARAVSPETSDAEGPRLMPRAGGFWLAWLARRADEQAMADASTDEAPAERRVFRWVEIVALDDDGNATGPVKRVTPERGRVAAFELLAGEADGSVVILAQDEAAAQDGAGDRVVRYVVTRDARVDGDVGRELHDAGVGPSFVDVVAEGGDPRPRWLAWTDPAERSRLAPLAPGGALAGPVTVEPALEGARVLTAAAPALLYVFSAGPGESTGGSGGNAGSPGNGGNAGSGRAEIRRLICP